MRLPPPMYATVKDKTTEEKQKLQTELLTNYNILVVDQALKRKILRYVLPIPCAARDGGGGAPMFRGLM